MKIDAKEVIQSLKEVGIDVTESGAEDSVMGTLIDQEAVAKKWRPLLTAVLVMSAASAVLLLFSGIISFAVGLRGAF